MKTGPRNIWRLVLWTVEITLGRPDWWTCGWISSRHRAVLWLRQRLKVQRFWPYLQSLLFWEFLNTIHWLLSHLRLNKHGANQAYPADFYVSFKLANLLNVNIFIGCPSNVALLFFFRRYFKALSRTKRSNSYQNPMQSISVSVHLIESNFREHKSVLVWFSFFSSTYKCIFLGWVTFKILESPASLGHVLYNFPYSL